MLGKCAGWLLWQGFKVVEIFESLWNMKYSWTGVTEIFFLTADAVSHTKFAAGSMTVLKTCTLKWYTRIQIS